MSALHIIGGMLLVGFATVGLVVIWLLATCGLQSTRGDVDDLVRIRRETAQASWSIHQKTSAAFAAMLANARQHNRDSSDPHDQSDCEQ